jgi:hypothetical protein
MKTSTESLTLSGRICPRSSKKRSRAKPPFRVKPPSPTRLRSQRGSQTRSPKEKAFTGSQLRAKCRRMERSSDGASSTQNSPRCFGQFVRRGPATLKMPQSMRRKVPVAKMPTALGLIRTSGRRKSTTPPSTEKSSRRIIQARWARRRLSKSSQVLGRRMPGKHHPNLTPTGRSIRVSPSKVRP